MITPDDLKSEFQKRDLEKRMSDFRDKKADAPLTDLRDFASSILDRKFTANTLINSQPSVPKARVESSFTSSPMTPTSFEAPKGRGRGAGDNTSESTTITSVSGAFYRTYVNGDGDTMLQGGIVKSGSGNFTIADLKVIDAGTGITEADGDVLVLEVTVDGYVVDGVLLAGLTATAASYISPSVSTVPSDTLPTVSVYAGRKVHIEIGRWTADAFYPSNIGNIRISFCPGAYQITRF